MIFKEMPLISCVTVTTGRIEHLKTSIPCYINQTWPNKNLVILSQGSDEVNSEIEKYIKSLGREDILFMTVSPDLCLGAMRNISVELACGDIVCQWDDDDIYHPKRLTTQYKALITNKNNVASAYSNFIKYFKDSGDVYWCDWSPIKEKSHKYLCGTVMFYKWVFFKFNSMFYPEYGRQCNVEEDLNVLEKMMKDCGDVAECREGNHYIYIYHGKNTYDSNHHHLVLNMKVKRVLTVDELLENQSIITEILDLGGIEHVNVRSNDEIAFTHPEG